MIDLSLHILDVATNGFKAGATYVQIKIVEEENDIKIWITDNGCGMSKEVLSQVENPFYTSRTTRKVGLGIPLFKQTCLQTGGSFEITSKEKIGTTIYALMYTNHIDAIPLGDLAETIFVLMMNPYECDILADVTFKDENQKPFVIDTKEIKKILDGVPLSDNAIATWLKEYINEGLSK